MDTFYIKYYPTGKKNETEYLFMIRTETSSTLVIIKKKEFGKDPFICYVVVLVLQKIGHIKKKNTSYVFSW